MADLDIAALVAQADLPAIASSFTEIKKRGGEYVARCVFHSPDNNPSLSIFQKNGKWNYKCFSCGEGGDALDWIQKLEGLSTTDAAKRLNGGGDWVLRVKPEPRRSVPERRTFKPPANEPQPEMSIRSMGAPTRVWPYRDAAGDVLMYAARYEQPDGGKEFRCWTWGAREGDEPEWGCAHWNRLERPLYGLEQLASKAGAPVMLVEGEKTADAARLLLPQYVVLTWPGGANAWKHPDWSVLAGKRVDLWPDNDEPGRAAMKSIAALIGSQRGLACYGKLVDPRGLPEGGDAADWPGGDIIPWLTERATWYQEKAKPAPVFRNDEPPIEAYAEDAGRYGEASAVLPVEKRATKSVLGEVFYRSMADIESKPISWLWPGRIAKGKVSMIVGNPGLGKSQVCASLASVVSNGGSWPVDRTHCDQGSVVILSAEDDPEDTIRPRLEAAGANLKRVFILDAIRVEQQDGDGKRGFDLTVDIGRLGAMLYELGDSALVVIDPITAYLGDADSHKNAEVRALLAPLAEMAAAQRVAVLAISHLTKSSGMDALLRVQGSVGFAAAARAVWGVAKDKDNPSRRLFMPLKNNLGTDSTGFAYSVEGVSLESNIETSHVMWENQIITLTADEVFGQQEQDHDEREAMLDAKSYLRSMLVDGAVAVKKIQADAADAGHSWATLRRAQKELKVLAYRDHGIGDRGKWYWRLDGQAER